MKKLVAVVLIIVMLFAMTVTTFAAEQQVSTTRACGHFWVQLGTEYRYKTYTKLQHLRETVKDEHCSQCGEHRKTVILSYYEDHTLPCNKCGM